MEFSERLYNMMKLRCMTVLEVSRASGVSRNEIYKLLDGEAPSQRMRVVKGLANALKCTPGWLLKK